MFPFVIPCDVNGKKVPVEFMLGEPEPKHHPLQHQSNWVSKERGVNIPADVMESLKRLHQIAIDNNVSFEELCTHALNFAQGSESQGGVIANAKESIPAIQEGGQNFLDASPAELDARKGSEG